MKKIYLVLSLIVAHVSMAQPLLYDGFNYTPSAINGLNVQSSGAWVNLNTGDSILVTANSLTYAGLAASIGNKVAFDGIGVDNYRVFSPQTTGTVYASCILNVSSLGTMNATGTYVLNFIETATTTTYGACVWLKASATAGKYLIGISNRTSASPVTYTTVDMNLNESYFIVFSYEIIAGLANDISRMWINTTQFGGTAPISTLTATGGTDLGVAGIGRILLRQPSVALSAPFVEFDEIRVGTTWADVTPCASPSSYYQDLDGDSYGNTFVMLSSCTPPLGYVLNSTDCQDNAATINPAAFDIPGNGIDEDCSGLDAPLVPLILGLYEFTGASGCPVLANTVTTQPVNALFSPFSNLGVICSSSANAFSASAWNLSNTIDLNQYNEFSIVADSCFGLNLSSFAFNHRTGSTGGSPTWILRSSLDNFTTNISSGLSGNNGNVVLDDTVLLSPAFLNIYQVTFRLYLINIGAVGSTWRVDNVSLYGNVVATAPQLYYADMDGDGFGNANNPLLSCTLPLGYTSNNTDCNDNDSLINPLTTWFVDADLDGFGNPNSVVTSCIQPPGTSINGLDCDDNNPNAYPGASDVLDNGIDENCDGVDNYLAIDEQSLESVVLMPNPAQSFVQIIPPANFNGLVEVLDLKGTVVYRLLFATDVINLSVESWSRGLYLVRLSAVNYAQVLKLVVE